MFLIEVTGGRLPDPAEVIPAELESAMTEVVALLEADVKRRTPIGVTEMGRGSIAGEVRMGAPLPVGTVIGMVGSPLKHVAVLNDGRRPGQKPPPAAALELWVRRKIVYSSDRKGPRGGRRKLTIAESKSLAFVIARSIGKKGFEGKHMFEDAMKDNEAKIRSIFERAGLQIAVRMDA